MRVWLLVILALSSVAAGEAKPGYSLSPKELSAPSPTTITRADARADLRFLEEVLRRGYAGFDVQAREGLDWDALFAELHATTDRMPEEVDVTDLRGLLVSTFLETLRDSHFSVQNESADGSRTRVTLRRHAAAVTLDLILDGPASAPIVRAAAGGDVEPGWRLTGCRGAPVGPMLRRTVAGEQLAPGWRVIDFVRTNAWTTPSAPKPMTCDFVRPDGTSVQRSVATRPLRVGDAPGPPFERIPNKRSSSVILRVRTFNPAHARELVPFVESAAEVRRSPAVIVDLRGNGGGTDEMATEWFASLFPEVRTWALDRLESDAAFAGSANALRAIMAGVEDAGSRVYLENVLRQVEGDLARIGTRRAMVQTPPRRVGKGRRAYGGTVVLIVDRNCASSCETLVYYARQTKRAIVVGENTAGATRFGNLALFRLPASGLRLSMGTWWLHGAVGIEGPIEGEGYQPDVWIDGDDPIAVAEWVARCAIDARCRPRLR